MTYTTNAENTEEILTDIYVVFLFLAKISEMKSVYYSEFIKSKCGLISENWSFPQRNGPNSTRE